MQKIIVSEKEAGQQLLKLLSKYLTKAPQSFFYKMLRKKNITLNGKKAEGKEKTVPGDCICLYVADDTIRLFGGEVLLESEETNKSQEAKMAEAKVSVSEKSISGTMPTSKAVPDGFSIVYEDADILLLNKPAGLLTQKATSQDVSLNEKLLDYLLATNAITQRELMTFRPAVCNRLDRNTSGLVAAGKTMAGLQFLSEAFRLRTLDKYYECIVLGELKEALVLDGYLKKEEKENRVHLISKSEYALLPDKTAYTRIQTNVRPLVSKDGVTFAEVELITGKTHQIRAHLAELGHPILGDTKYGVTTTAERMRKQFGVKYQQLHARRLVFRECPGHFSYLNGKCYLAPRPALLERVLQQLGML